MYASTSRQVMTMHVVHVYICCSASNPRVTHVVLCRAREIYIEQMLRYVAARAMLALHTWFYAELTYAAAQANSHICCSASNPRDSCQVL